jgi:hypothetical protein
LLPGLLLAHGLLPEDLPSLNSIDSAGREREDPSYYSPFEAWLTGFVWFGGPIHLMFVLKFELFVLICLRDIMHVVFHDSMIPAQ